jgi:hypothetical protein
MLLKITIFMKQAQSRKAGLGKITKVLFTAAFKSKSRVNKTGLPSNYAILLIRMA